MAIAEETPNIEPSENEEFHPAVKLLLARMASDPEEFAPPRHRWTDALGQCQTFCTEPERNALEAKLREIIMDAVHVKVMKIMTSDPYENDAKSDVDVTARGSTGLYGNMASQAVAMQQKQAANNAQMALQAHQAKYAAIQEQMTRAMETQERAYMQGYNSPLQGLSGSRPSTMIFDEYQSIVKEQTPSGVRGLLSRFGF